MKTKNLALTALVVGATLALLPRLIKKHTAEKPPTAGSSFEAIDSYIEQERRRLRIPGVSLAIVRGEQIAHLRGYGLARPRGEAPTPETPFFIGSLTKSFTALAIMQLVQAGKIELDAPILRYLHWFRVADPVASTQVTVRHLLNQTSGIPTSAGEIPLADFDQHPGATERQARTLSTLVLSHPVGSAFEYSNVNYNLLGLVIQAVSGESYADYIQTNILTPLEMTHTYTLRTKAEQNGLAVGHQYWFGFPLAVAKMPLPYGSLPAGLLISCTRDLSHYLIAFMNEGRYKSAQILSIAGLEELEHGAAEFGVMGIPLGKYAMGWFEGNIGESRLVWHGGTLPDFAAYMAFLPDQKQGVVMLFNASHHWMTPVLAEFGTGVTAMLAGEKPATIPFVRVIPWALRLQLALPAIELWGGVTTILQWRRGRLEPENRPRTRQALALQLVLSLIPILPAALMLRPVFSKRRGYLKLYMPDTLWMTRVCGSFAAVWVFFRTGLVLDALLRVRREHWRPGME